MSLSAKVGAFDTGTGAVSSTVVINDVGFQPKVVLCWWDGRTDTTDAVGRATHSTGFGAFSATTERGCQSSLAQDTPTSMVTNRVQRDDCCIVTTTTGDAIDGKLDVQSLDSGGFTLVVDDQFTTSVRVQYLALGGDDITNALVSNFAKITTTGTQNYTGVGFQADGVLFFGSIFTAASSNPGVDSNLFLGWAQSAAKQGVWHGNSNDASANAQAVSYLSDANCIAHGNGSANGLVDLADFTQFTSTGFDLNWSISTASAYVIFYVAIKGCAIDIGSLLTQTDTTTTFGATTGFEPKAALFLSHAKAESTGSTVQDDDEWSLGAFTSTSARQAMAHMDNDAAGTAEVTTAVEYDAVYISLTDNGGTLQGLADVNSITATGFDLIMDDADPAQAMILYMAFGTPPQTITATVGALAIAGRAATVTPGAVTITATVGALSIAGQQGTVSTTGGGSTVQATVGALAIAGQSATVTPGAVTVQASVGTIASAGRQATVTPGAATVQATPGALVIAGQQASIVATVTIQSAVGALVIAGQSASVTPGAVSITATPGALIIAGQQGSVSAGGGSPQTVQANVGTLAIAGQSGAVQPGAVSVTATAGLLDSSGVPATVIPGAVTITANVGALVIAGQQGNVSTPGGPQTITANVGALTITGHTGSIQSGLVPGDVEMVVELVNEVTLAVELVNNVTLEVLPL